MLAATVPGLAEKQNVLRPATFEHNIAIIEHLQLE
jgi:hypothetical protein